MTADHTLQEMQPEIFPEEVELATDRAEDLLEAYEANRPNPKSDPDAAIEDLLARMGSQRKILLEIISLCREACPLDRIDQHIGQLRKGSASVYRTATMVSMLECAGALTRTDGTGDGDERDARLRIEVVGGIECLTPVRRSQALWVATEAGMRALDADNPAARLRELVFENETYLPIYARILEECGTEGGATTKRLSDTVDDNPRLQSPRLFAQFFIERLERGGALEWTGAWHMTTLGERCLNELVANGA